MGIIVACGVASGGGTGARMSKDPCRGCAVMGCAGIVEVKHRPPCVQRALRAKRRLERLIVAHRLVCRSYNPRCTAGTCHCKPLCKAADRIRKEKR